MAAERLQKILARAGIASRRASEEIIEQRRVTVNGKVATVGMSADPVVDDIRVDGERLRMPDAYDYILLNKPPGVISDEDVSGEHPAARELIPLEGHLYPVGRLDLDSEGLMLFTNDGDLAHKLTHPRYEHRKTYRVLVEGSPSEEVLDHWRQGVVIEGRRTLPADVRKVIKTRKGTILEVRLREGRKRQIRHVAAKLGHPVLNLVRTSLGPLQLGDLPSGAWRRLTDEEIAAIRKLRQSRPQPMRTKGAAPARRSSDDRRERPRRPVRTTGVHGDRTDRAERSPRDWPERGERPGRAAGPGRTRSESSQRGERSERPRRGGLERAGRDERSERPGRPPRRPGAEGGEPPKRPRRPGRGRAEQADRAEGPPAGRSQRPRRPDRSTRPERAGRPERPPTTNRPSRTGRTESRNKPKRGTDRE